MDIQTYNTYSDDAGRFINQCVIINNPIVGLTEFQMRGYQEKLLNDFHFQKRHHIILKSRQVGLTTTFAAYCLWKIIFKNNYKIGYVSNSRLSTESFFEKFHPMYDHLHHEVKKEVYKMNCDKMRVLSPLTNSSVDTYQNRGVHYDEIIVDEMDFLNDPYRTHEGIMCNHPSARLILSSSMKTEDGYFNTLFKEYEQCGREESYYYPTKITWRDVPGRGQLWREAVIGMIGPDLFKTEFLD